jgi:hypothetical protein
MNLGLLRILETPTKLSSPLSSVFAGGPVLNLVTQSVQ